MTRQDYRPRWVFNIWCSGCGDDYCARDVSLPIGKPKRLFWRVRGCALMALFGWWQWTDIPPVNNDPA